MTLEFLRENPQSACRMATYKTSAAPGAFPSQGRTGLVEGGPCRIEHVATGGEIRELRASEAGSGPADGYFYPWVRSGVGWVPVPVGAPDGTVVLTGGLNGCAIEVTRDGDRLNFYHDGDSRHLTDEMRSGATIVRLTGTDYDRLDVGLNQFGRATERALANGYRGQLSFAHYIVAIKQGGRWGMYVTGVSEAETQERLPLPWGNVPCLVTFDA